MMTPLEKAQQILDQIVAKATPLGPDYVLPDLRYVQLGTPVISCASVIVAGLSLATDGASLGILNVDCDAMQVCTFQVTIARDCSWVANEDGSDDPTRVAQASAMLSSDGELLWDYAQHFVPMVTKQWNNAWDLIGGIGISTLALTTEVD